MQLALQPVSNTETAALCHRIKRLLRIITLTRMHTLVSLGTSPAMSVTAWSSRGHHTAMRHSNSEACFVHLRHSRGNAKGHCEDTQLPKRHQWHITPAQGKDCAGCGLWYGHPISICCSGTILYCSLLVFLPVHALLGLLHLCSTCRTTTAWPCLITVIEPFALSNCYCMTVCMLLYVLAVQQAAHKLDL